MRYDVEFQPPAPIATVRLWNLLSRVERKDVRVAIDSGADVSLLPLRVIEELCIEPAQGRVFELVGFDGSRSKAIAADVGMEWLGKKIRGRFLLIDRELGILGRDVLNHYRLLLDGPGLEWNVG